MRIGLISRKKYDGQYSIENVFNAILEYLPPNTVFYASPFSSKGIIARLRLGLHARRQRFDLNHVTGDIMFAALFLPKKKTVVTVHDCEFIHRAKGIKRQLLFFFWLYWPLKRAAYITTISKATKSDILTLVDIPPSKIKVIPNPLTLVSQARPTFPKQNTPPVLLHIGTKENKNLHRLIPAIEGLELHLRIIGRLDPKQIELLELYHVNYSNVFNIDDSALITEYQKADALAFVSTLEGFGLPIVEAQALGCPVITSNCSSMPEVAGDAVLLADPFDIESIRQGITRLIFNKELQKDLIKKGYDNIARFKPENIAKQYSELYQLVLNRLN